jgi:tripartite-type tricarboxylate transporter receptor subunit TctC
MSLKLVKAADIDLNHVPYEGSPPALPAVPTFAEQGYAMLDDAARMGLWIKPGVPEEVQKKIRHATL